MGENSKIQWCHHTFNPWRGCTKVSQGCKNCYAETLSGRNPSSLGVWGPKGTRSIAAEAYWKFPAKWNKEAAEVGERQRVFCASLADVFEGNDTMPAEAWAPVELARRRLFKTIEETPNLDWLLLTKRPDNVMAMVPDSWKDRFPSNIWLGTSAEDQSTLQDRASQLIASSARVKFLSLEPLIGSINLYDSDVITGCFDEIHVLIHWVIVGGESGPGARPMEAEWVRGLRDQCVNADIPFFFKQWGGVKKEAFGRELDGVTWDQFPEGLK